MASLLTLGCSVSTPHPSTPSYRLASAAPAAAPRLIVEQPAEEHPSPGLTRLVGGKTLDRRQLIRAVLERNPSVEAARQAWHAARAGESQQHSLPDPVFSYTLAPLSIASSEVRFGQIIQLSQRFPWPGKLARRGEIALAEAEARRANIETTRLDLTLVASNLFDDWYAIERALEVNARFSALFEQLKRSAEAQYSVGRGSLQDPLQAEVELAHLDHQRVVLTSERATLRARLNALLHRRPDARLPPPPERLDDATQPPLAWAALTRIALANRPELKNEQALIERNRAAIALAEREYWPDFTLMAQYNSMWARIEHQIMVGFSTNLPLQRASRDGASDQARAQLSAERHRLSRLLDDIRAEVEEARLGLIEAQHVVSIYGTRLLPAGRDQLEAALPGFQTGSTSFNVVVAAHKNLLTTELGRHMAVAEMYRRLARLNRALGRVPSELLAGGER